jgi:RNA polymerase sigma-54 factor
MKLGLDIKTTLTQTLTPQQIQYLKLLQLPQLQLEQHLIQEIEQNPMLEEEGEFDEFDEEPIAVESVTYESADAEDGGSEPAESIESYIDDDKDPFEFYNMVWQDDSEFMPIPGSSDEDDEDGGFQIKSSTSSMEELTDQLRMLDLTDEEMLLGAQIIGNIDEDGYLRRDLQEITDETNSLIAEFNFKVQQEEYLARTSPKKLKSSNPALEYALSEESKSALESAELLKEFGSKSLNSGSYKNGHSGNGKVKILSQVSLDTAEKLLKIIQRLDPPGIGSRDIRECLLAQLDAIPNLNQEQLLAQKILEEAYEPFVKKHYQAITKQFKITEDTLRDVIEEITSLNPKPGGGDYTHENNTVIPDFSVLIDEETDDLIISVNDSRMPNLKLSKAYEALKKEAKAKNFNKDTRNWIRSKYEDAKFMIQAIKQRKQTMLKVMTAIAGLQRDFFYEGKSGLKPLIYKNVAEQTGLDISTVCRIVNGKYVQTPYGTYELKFFFSEALPGEDGEDVSTTVIKDHLKEIIDSEPMDKPYSDDKLSKMLKERGYQVARRTVAKYREQLKIPVARLRRSI